MSNLERYKEIFGNVFSVAEDQLNETFTFANIEFWDSISHLTLISELEEAFDVFFETEDILHFGGYENGIEILKKYGVSFDE